MIEWLTMVDNSVAVQLTVTIGIVLVATWLGWD